MGGRQTHLWCVHNRSARLSHRGCWCPPPRRMPPNTVATPLDFRFGSPRRCPATVVRNTCFFMFRPLVAQRFFKNNFWCARHVHFDLLIGCNFRKFGVRGATRGASGEPRNSVGDPCDLGTGMHFLRDIKKPFRQALLGNYPSKAS